MSVLLSVFSNFHNNEFSVISTNLNIFPTGHGGCINSALSFRMLQPLSRLTYCAYLVHPVIMVLTSFQLDGPLHIHNALTLILYFGNVVASFLLSFCISLTLEAPIVRLLKITMAPKARRTLKEINEWASVACDKNTWLWKSSNYSSHQSPWNNNKFVNSVYFVWVKN